VKVSAALVAEVPAGVVTVTSTGPDDPAGDTAVKVGRRSDTERHSCCRAELDRGRSAKKPLPVTVTEVPPAIGPVFGLTEETVGEGAP